MRALAWTLGLAMIGGLVVLAVAGLPAAGAVLLTGVAVLAMIALGSLLGGRNTPQRPPIPLEGPTVDPGPVDSTGQGGPEETMDR